MKAQTSRPKAPPPATSTSITTTGDLSIPSRLPSTDVDHHKRQFLPEKRFTDATTHHQRLHTLVMFPLPSPSSLISPESIRSAMPPPDDEIDFGRDVEEEEEEQEGEEEEEDEEEQVGSGDNEEEVLSGTNETTENCKDRIEEPKVGMEFDSSNEAYAYYLRYAKQQGFAVAKRTSRKGKDGNLKNLTLQCNRGGKVRVRGSNLVKPRPQIKIDCPARFIVASCPDGKWRLNLVVLEHNHEQSQRKCRFFKSNRVIDEHVKRNLMLNDKAGIKLPQTYASLQIKAGGPDKLRYSQKDCRNYVDKQRRLKLVERDAEAMHSYFMRMKIDNSDFFYAMDLDDKGRLRNVFWADARSRAACKEFGDVVTFDTTYLVNRYDMPFAPFVGVNHHGQSILLRCGLISHEDTKSFAWLFETWKTCMWGCAPKAIINDQCLGMKNAIQKVFPDTRHRLCIWHIMKKVPEKFGMYNAYEQISSCMRKAVWNSLTIKQFEDAWDGFIKKYEL
ncbi:hypothetical protein RHMOL_Rhmol12G0093200 [Rhododendron molle]|uniref:Uncharacterized protein n=1 Tax=Rhododendron molle TaxID=49168 RepID=A0ACC0LHA9_RHOML|nr:hypothetical protein RHMOL_Rhmol12G0093200 [Rhododendron molle]